MPSIYRDDHPETDLYIRRPFAARLYQHLKDTPQGASLCVALTGPWGNGKTTTLEYLAQEQRADDPLSITYFEPLIYENPDDLVRSFYNKIIAAVGKKDRDTAKRLGKLLKALSIGSRGVGFAAEVIIPSAGLWSTIGSITSLFAAASPAVKEAAELTKEFEKGPRSPEKLLADARNVMANSKTRVIVLIDEVDRLIPREIQNIFRLIRMIANFPNVTYLVAFDREMVVEALAQHFVQSDNSRRTGSHYLEKIFQLEIPLPHPDRSLVRRVLLDELQKILDSHLAGTFKISDEDANRFALVLDRCLIEGFRNLRVVKRFWSQLNTLLPEVKGNVNLGDFLILEGLRACDPRGYGALKENFPLLLQHRDIARDNNTETQQIVADLVKQISVTNPRSLLTTLFPRLQSSGSNEPSREEIMQLRVSAPRFAFRHFNYSVGSDDIATITSRNLVIEAEEGRLHSKFIGELISNNPDCIDHLLEDLSDFSEATSPTGAINLAHALAENLTLFPRPDGMWRDLPVARASRLCADLVRKTSEIDWAKNIETLLKNKDLLGGAVLLNQFRPRQPSQRAEDDTPRYLAASAWDALATHFTKRLEEEDKISPLFTLEPRGSIRVLYKLISEFGSKGDLERRLLTQLSGNQKYLLRFLLEFVGYAHAGSWHGPSDLERDNYDWISRLVNATTLYKMIVGNIPLPTITDEYPRSGLRIYNTLSSKDGTMQAAQFVWLHDHPKSTETQS